MISKVKKIFLFSFLIVMVFAGLTVYQAASKPVKRIIADGGKIAVEFDKNLKSRVISKIDNYVILGKYNNSEFAEVDGKNVNDYKLVDYKVNEWQDSIGKGKEYLISGVSKNLKKKISIISYNDFPTMLFYRVIYQNIGKQNFTINSWTNNNYSISSKEGKDSDPKFWSFQPGSYGWDNYWIIPLQAGYSRENYLGMNHPEYGGGTPVADIWRPDYGVAIGHVEMVPKYVSFPVSMPNNNEAELAMNYKKEVVLKPGEELSTFRTFVEVHKGDHYNSLILYRQFMERQGIKFKDTPSDDYGTEWCSWGLERDFTMEQIYNTLPKAKELGLDWIVLDMEWYDKLGEFNPNKNKFPNGDEDIIKFVQMIHKMGFKIQLWWMPFAVEPNSEILSKHYEYLLNDEDGAPHFMPLFFKSFYMCPASKAVVEFSKQLVTKFLKWGFDGLKIDGNNMNCAPPCYNPEHNHLRPEESNEGIPAFFKMVYETALSINPDAKIEICPCGTNQSFFLMPYMNETVASDPHNSWMVRQKGKTLRALTGQKTLFYGDHVELSDNKSDFASTIGVGGAIGTKFVYPPGVHMNTETGDINLTPEKEKIWKKWIDIYNANMLSKGIYMGELYDIGFDRPETHAIQKDNVMYYALYAPEFNGEIALKGLDNKSYKVTDYENNIELGNIEGLVGKIKVNFKIHLLIKAEPI
jgi:alpha-galactosidase